MTTVRVRVPARNDRYTEEACAMLVGQEPRWLPEPHNHERPGGVRCRIVAATTDPDTHDLLLDLDVPNGDRADLLLGLIPDPPDAYSLTDDDRALFTMGYHVGPSGARHRGRERTVSDLRVLDVGVMPPDPADPVQRPGAFTLVDRVTGDLCPTPCTGTHDHIAARRHHRWSAVEPPKAKK